MSQWVDLQLAHQLAPEKAPDELWSRIQTCPRSRRRAAPRLAVAAAAVVAVIAVAYSSTKPREAPRVSAVSMSTCGACHL